VCFGRQPSTSFIRGANPVPILRKARNGNSAHETGRIKKNCGIISPKLRNHFPKTAKWLTRMRSTPRPRPSPPCLMGSPPRLARPQRPPAPHSPQASPTALNDFATEHGHSFANSRTVASGAGREITNHTQHRPAPAVHACFHEPINQWATQDSNL
jgi:hypothetical protein